MAPRCEEMLRRRRQLTLTQEGLAERVGIAPSTIRSWELGRYKPTLRVRPALARALQVSTIEVDRWFEDEPVTPAAMDVPGWLGHYAALEQGAAELWMFDPWVIPGLLQIASYASALERGVVRIPTTAELDSAVRHRLARQRVLDRDRDPLKLSVVIDESVLLRVAGDGEIMAEQLDHLSDVATRPNVDLRVLSLRSGVFAGPMSNFAVLTSPGAHRPYMACTFEPGGPLYHDRAHELDLHIELFRHLQRMAHSPAESIELIRKVARERYS